MSAIVSRSAKYALRFVFRLADHPDTTLLTGRLAGRTPVPKGYLAAKVLPARIRASLVESNPGRGVLGKGLLPMSRHRRRPATRVELRDMSRAGRA